VNISISIMCDNRLKRQRMMILTGDEMIIDQIKNSQHASLCQVIVLDNDDNHIDVFKSNVCINRVRI
jgi:hypothetical protein